MSGRYFFISDLHLDAARPAVVDAFAQFLDARRDATALYILGDLFEFWVGDDDDSEIAERVARLLREYHKAGPDIYLMHGNRDFLIGERFAARVGATLLPDPRVVERDGQRLLLMHGDSLCTRDEAYQSFRSLARSSDWQESVLKESLAKRREMAKGLREVSRDAGSRKAADIMDVTEREVIKVMQNAHCRILIHGHTHRPARHEDRSGVRWVLGDLDKTGWYIELQSGDIQLVEFDINQ
jgi:UDP-2,3-diacylglucosamine hydrolase